MLLGNFIMKCCAIQFSGQRLDAIEYPFCGMSYIGLWSQLKLCSSPPHWSRYKGADGRARKHMCNLNDIVESVISAGQEALNRGLEA